MNLVGWWYFYHPYNKLGAIVNQQHCKVNDPEHEDNNLEL